MTKESHSENSKGETPEKQTTFFSYPPEEHERRLRIQQHHAPTDRW
jgi:hypothetical protein